MQWVMYIWTRINHEFNLNNFKFIRQMYYDLFTLIVTCHVSINHAYYPISTSCNAPPERTHRETCCPNCSSWRPATRCQTAPSAPGPLAPDRPAVRPSPPCSCPLRVRRPHTYATAAIASADRTVGTPRWWWPATRLAGAAATGSLCGQSLITINILTQLDGRISYDFP